MHAAITLRSFINGGSTDQFHSGGLLCSSSSPLKCGRDPTYRCHTTTQISPRTAHAKKDDLQPANAITYTTIGALTAAPMYAPASNVAVARPRCSKGKNSRTIRANAGKIGASPIPTAILEAIREMGLHTAPEMAV